MKTILSNLETIAAIIAGAFLLCLAFYVIIIIPGRKIADKNREIYDNEIKYRYPKK